jgi:hypothetical protein
MERFTEFINTAGATLATELISPNAIFHVLGRTEPLRDPAGYLTIIGMVRAGFPDSMDVLWCSANRKED